MLALRHSQHPAKQQAADAGKGARAEKAVQMSSRNRKHAARPVDDGSRRASVGRKDRIATLVPFNLHHGPSACQSTTAPRGREREPGWGAPYCTKTPGSSLTFNVRAQHVAPSTACMRRRSGAGKPAAHQTRTVSCIAGIGNLGRAEEFDGHSTLCSSRSDSCIRLPCFYRHCFRMPPTTSSNAPTTVEEKFLIVGLQLLLITRFGLLVSIPQLRRSRTTLQATRLLPSFTHDEIRSRVSSSSNASGM
ncbi:hypothetical protein BJ546DRAFT_367491 [Cryomyces antarcticus]